MGTGMNFYPRVWVQIQISNRNIFAGERVIALPDPNPTRCHPWRRRSWGVNVTRPSIEVL
jgi:hypothetical protein